MIEGVTIMNLVIALLENMQGMIDQALPQIITIITEELNFLLSAKETYVKKYKSMLLQTMSMCFSYNTALTFQVLESQNLTLSVFQAWFMGMNDFKKDFELRRNIFGLGSIIKCPQLPQLVSAKLPDIMN